MQGNTKRTHPMRWFNDGLILGLHGNNHGSMVPQKRENEPNLPTTHLTNASHIVQGRCRWNGGHQGPGWGSAKVHVLRPNHTCRQRMLNRLGQSHTNLRKRSGALDGQVGGTSGSAEPPLFSQTRPTANRPHLLPTSTHKNPKHYK
jgi:hypothetical protein